MSALRSFLVLASLLPACKPAQSVEPAPAELPVTKVVLYQNGVGYFERRGEVEADRLDLRVRPDQINDVLKSLTVLDLSGGAASSVALPVEKSGDRLAAELPPQVREAKGLIGLLAVLRGADVEVHTADDSLKGRVVGVEMPPPSLHKGPDGEPLPPRGAVLTLMVGADQLQTVTVDAIEKLTIGDRTLSVGLQQSLDISKSEGAWKPVSLHVRLAGKDDHDLIVSYIHEVPVWRPAYRAWVEAGKGVQLQGWAIVDNTSGEDWKDVKLTLVAGAPLSFRYNLHTPHHVDRPDLSPRLPQVADAPPEPDIGIESAADVQLAMPVPAGSAAPAMESAPPEEHKAFPRAAMAKKSRAHKSYLVTDGAMDKDSAAPNVAADEGGGGPGMRRLGSGGGGGGRGDGWAAKPEMDAAEETRRREAAMRSATALVTGKEVGALYAYEAMHPVTVPDRSAALINILSRKLDGEDVFLYREPTSGQAPFRAILLRNDQAGTLEGGPITLYIDGTFAGEGFIGRVQKGETTFVPYARESGFTLQLRADAESSELHLARIVDGRIRLEGKRLAKRTVTIESGRNKPSLCYVKLAVSPGMTLREPPKNLVKAGADVFLPVQVPAKGKGEAALFEETPVTVEDIVLTDRVVEAFRLYLKNATAEQAVKGPIEELLKLHEDMAGIDRESEGLRRQQEVLSQEQYRIQGNLDALPGGAVAADLRRQLVGQLEAASKKAAEVAKKLVEAEVRLAALKEKLVVVLRGVSLR